MSAIIAREVDHAVKTSSHGGQRESRQRLFRPDDYVYRPAGSERRTLVCDWEAAHGRESRREALSGLTGPMSLAAILDAAIESLPKADRARRIERKLHDPEIRLTRDPLRTAQALIRLLANACRFSSSATPISIRSRIDTADDSDHLVLTIADRGVGISRAHLYALVRRGEFPVVRFGKLTRVSQQALRDFIATGGTAQHRTPVK